MDRRFLGILAAIAVIFVIIFAVSQNGNGSGSTGSGSSSQPTHHVTGQGQAGVTLVEYGDYQCPVCGAYYQPLKQVVSQYSQDIYFQFRNLPLSPNPHPNAFAAARAAEAAGLQGKYWPMHDKLYENQEQWSGASNPQSFFNDYAQQIGLNMNRFRQDYASEKVNNAVNSDLAAFKKTGKPMSTPTFYLDGKYIDNNLLTDPQTGGPSVDKISDVIKAEIAKKQNT